MPERGTVVVADAAQLVLEAALQHFGRIDGLAHIAGVGVACTVIRQEQISWIAAAAPIDLPANLVQPFSTWEAE